MSVESFVEQLTRATKRLPGNEELAAAAKRAADRTNTQLAQSGFNQRCVVLGKEHGYRVELRTVGRGIGRRPTGGLSPLQLLEQNVHQEVTRAARETKNRGLPQ